MSNKSNTKRVIAVGRLSEEKGFEKLISAWNIVTHKHRDWELVIFGEGEKHNSIKKQIDELCISDTTHITKPTKEIMKEYQKSAICVMSSRYEGFGMILIEAMECGVPCVAFNCPNGPKEIIEEGKNGLLVENGNINELAASIMWMIEHENERKKMGQYAHISVQKYSRETIMKQWNDLFLKTIAQ